MREALRSVVKYVKWPLYGQMGTLSRMRILTPYLRCLINSALSLIWWLSWEEEGPPTPVYLFCCGGKLPNQSLLSWRISLFQARAACSTGTMLHQQAAMVLTHHLMLSAPAIEAMCSWNKAKTFLIVSRQPKVNFWVFRCLPPSTWRYVTSESSDFSAPVLLCSVFL